MKLKDFKVERYFAKYEFSAPFLLSCSDCEPLTLQELLALADKDSLKQWNNLWLGYTDSQGSPAVRKEIAKMYTSTGEDNILTVVPQEGIFLTMHGLLKKGDHIIAPFPAYQSLYENACSIGCEVSFWKPESGTWRFNIQDLKSMMKKNTRMIIINFPHNPTGSMITNQELHEIVALAKKQDCYIFSDEMYRLLEFDKKNRLDSVCDIYQKGICLFGLSKSFGLPGLRFGWLASQNQDAFEKIMALKDYLTICGSAPSEALALIALRVKDAIIERNNTIVKENLKLLKNFVERYSDIFSLSDPQAGSIAFVEYKGSGTVDAFAQKCVKEQGVMILPGSTFDYPGNYFRVGLGRKNFSKVLQQFEKCL